MGDGGRNLDGWRGRLIVFRRRKRIRYKWLDICDWTTFISEVHPQKYTGHCVIAICKARQFKWLQTVENKRWLEGTSCPPLHRETREGGGVQWEM